MVNRRYLYLVIFAVGLVVATPSIIKILSGNFDASQMFSHNPFESAIKSIVLRNYPEWKSIEAGVEKTIPNSTSNVSVSTLYANQTSYTDLEISVATDEKMSDSQLELSKSTVCEALGSNATKFSHIKMTVNDFKFTNQNIQKIDIKCP